MTRCPYCGKEIPAEEFAKHLSECEPRLKLIKPKPLLTRLPEVPKEEEKITPPPELKIIRPVLKPPVVPPPKEEEKIILPKIEPRKPITGIRCPWCGQLFDVKEFAEHHAKCPSRPQTPKPAVKKMTKCPYCGKEMLAEEFAQHHAKCPLRPKRLEARIPEVPKEEVGKVLKPPKIKPKRLEKKVRFD